MFEKIFEKRSVGENPFDWTAWGKGNDDNLGSSDSTYLKCIDLYAENVAKLPIVTKINSKNGEVEADNFYLYELLRLRPNPHMNAFETIKSLVVMLKHYGCSGLYIDYDTKGLVKALYPVKIDNIIVDNAGLINSTKANKVLVEFTCGNNSGTCFDDKIIILKDNSINGIQFKSTKTLVKDIIDTNVKAQRYQTDLFANGLTNKAVVQLTSDIKDEKDLKKLQEKFNRLYSSKGRIFTIPAGFNITPLNLSLADSQFAELKIIGKKEISSAIGVPYSLIEKGTLNEEETISLLNNIIPVITALEQEFDWKLLTSRDRKKGYKIRFNVNAMLRTTPVQQSTIIDRYLRNGAYTLNDAKRILGVPLVNGGDVVTLPSGQITLENLMNGNATWQKNSTMEGGDNDEQGKNQD